MTLKLAPHATAAGYAARALEANFRFIRALAALLVTLTLSACAANLGSAVNSAATLAEADAAANSKPQKPVRIAMILPLSGYGPTAAIAKGMKQAGELALFELDNPLVQLIVKDDKGTSSGAMAAADEAIREGAEIIIGPLTAGATTAIAPIARRAGIPILTFSNDRRVAGDGVYLMSFLPEQEIDRIVLFAASRGKRRFAALIPDDPYGAVVEEAYRQAVERSGGSLASIVRYSANANAMLTPVRSMIDEIKQSDQSGLPIDTLLVAGGAEALPQIGPLITYSGIDGTKVKLIGTGGWDYPNVGHNTALVGGWYPAPDPHGWREFAQRFSRSFGTAPPRLASLSYDAVSLAIALAPFEPKERYTPVNITRPSGFNGVDGMLRFSPKGLPERQLAVLELQPMGASVIDPPPGGGHASHTNARSVSAAPAR